MITMDTKCFRTLIMSKLLRYRITITIGGYVDDFANEPNSSSKILRLYKINLDECNISQRIEVEALQVIQCNGTAKSLLLDLNGSGFPELRYLRIHSDFGGSCILNSIIFPVLEYLELLDIALLEKICDRSIVANSLLNLKEIHVQHCENLRNIFYFSSLVGVLPNLTYMDVFVCNNMEEIFGIEEQVVPNVAPYITINKLSHLTLSYLPALVCFAGMTKTASTLQLGSVSTEELNHSFSLFDEKVLSFLWSYYYILKCLL